MQAQFARRCCRETIRRALHRLKLSWQKAHKLLGRAEPEKRAAFVAQIGSLLDAARDERHLRSRSQIVRSASAVVPS